jgi:NAD(P)H dehydrogenase (quinone)
MTNGNGGNGMKALILYAHPNPKSFCAAMKETLVKELKEKGHEVRIRDLYEIGFNPVLHADDFNEFFQNRVPADIKEEQDHIAWADLLVFVYPTWWIGMPAILKGYIGRIVERQKGYCLANDRFD